jgi:hypothetical protein
MSAVNPDTVVNCCENSGIGLRSPLFECYSPQVVGIATPVDDDDGRREEVTSLAYPVLLTLNTIGIDTHTGTCLS